MMDYGNMEPGREMDAEVARHVLNLNVLGFEVCGACEGEWSIEPGASLERTPYYREVRPVYLKKCICDIAESSEFHPRVFEHDVQCLEIVPSYSTDISAAWRVVKVYDPDYKVKLYNHGAGWTFVIYKDATHYEGDAPTVPLAICRAALKAVRSNAIAPAREAGV